MKRAASVTDEDLSDMIAEVRRLNPKPGLKYGSAPAQPIVPDVLVRSLPDGSYHVELNSDTLPKVLINQRYYAQVSTTTRTDKDKAYLADCLQNATWLVRALDQRAKTILKVAAEIVKLASKFRSDITIMRDDLEVNGKSIMGLVMLAAAKGTELTIECSGNGSEEALDELITLINDKFGTES